MLKRVLILALCPLIALMALSQIYRAGFPPSTSMIWDAVTLDFPERRWVPLSQISPQLIAAVITAEDGAFCQHWGVDFVQMQKSIERAQERRRPVRATSTITQQLAKNLFLWNDRSWLRKSLEVPLAFWLELTWPKRRILETYLNVAQWGQGIYGAEAAARHYFGVSARKIDSRQAALLATALPNPERRRPSNPGPVQQEIANNLLSRMPHNTSSFPCIR